MERPEGCQTSSQVRAPVLCRYNETSMRRTVRHSPPLLFLAPLLAALVLAAAGATMEASAPARRPAGGALLWPIEVPGTLLSTFGEYRYDHLHAGIDISTQGATGYRVLAAAAGTVYRLKVEWRGYGRALYIRHPGGRVTVYGHLERFEDRVLGLERRVTRRQAEAKTRYPGDIYLDPPLPVRRGQLIGLSGESGIGLPHLHFEVREREDEPIDPFAAGLRPPADRRRPVLVALTVTAADPSTFIDGVLREMSFTFTARQQGPATTDGPLRVNGPFIVALDAYDPAGAGGRAGVRSVQMAIDGATRYRLTLRSFRFDQYPQAGLLYDHRGSRLGPAAFSYRLVRLPGSDLATGDERRETPPASYPGAIDLEPGPHVMEIVATDAAGNRGVGRLCVLAERPGRPRILDAGAEPGTSSASIRFALDEVPLPGSGRVTRLAPSNACPVPGRAVEGGVWSGAGDSFTPLSCHIDEGTCAPASGPQGLGGVVRLREVRGGVPGTWEIHAPQARTSAEALDRERRVETYPGFLDVVVPAESPGAGAWSVVGGLRSEPLAPLLYRDGLIFGAGIDYHRAALSSPLAIAAGHAPLPLDLDVRFLEPRESLTYEGPGFTLEVPAGGRFFPGPLVVRASPTAGDPVLPAVGDAVDLLPEGEALDARATLTFHLTGAIDPQALGIYRWDRFRSRWSYEGGDPTDGPLAALSIRLRRYGRFALLQDASPPVVAEVRPGDGSTGLPRRPRIWARIEEEGEGLGFDGVTFVLDGVPLESEFDPDRAVSRVLDDPRLVPGRHHLLVTATDLAGNPSAPVEVWFEVR
jgi:hypothetical protein